MDWAHPLCLKTLRNTQKTIPRCLFRTFSIDFTTGFRISHTFSVCHVLFFSQRGYGDAAGGIISEMSKSSANFFCFGNKSFFVSQNRRFYTQGACFIEIEATGSKMLGMGFIFWLWSKKKKIGTGFSPEVIFVFGISQKEWLWTKQELAEYWYLALQVLLQSVYSALAPNRLALYTLSVREFNTGNSTRDD